MQALIGLERYKEAMKLYEQTSKHYFEELGVTPSEKLVEQYRYLGSRMGSRHRVIEEVQADLQESPEHSSVPSPDSVTATDLFTVCPS